MFMERHDGVLIELTESPYDSEAVLQQLLESYPNLLAGAQMDSVRPRRWLLLSREIGIPGEEAGAARWALDHLFLDQDGIPTLVEVKRSADTRIRREVVGQMLDYAANAVVYWPLASLRTQFEARCEARGEDPSLVIATALGRDDPEALWQQVATNLQAGRIRLVFVADRIPQELQRIIEFLNGQMTPAEVLGIEIRQFKGENVRTFVPRVLGQTAMSTATKRTTQARRSWDEASFFVALTQRCSEPEVAAGQELYQRLNGAVNRLWWGQGQRDGSCYCMLDHDAVPHYIAALWTSGHVEIPFQFMGAGPFADLAQRQAFLERLNAIPGVSLAPTRVTGSPYLPLKLFVDAGARRQLMDTLQWAIDTIRGSSEISPAAP
jgi:hypothetical protein